MSKKVKNYVEHRYAFHLPIEKGGIYRKIKDTNVWRSVRQLQNETVWGLLPALDIANEIICQLFKHGSSQYRERYVRSEQEWVFSVNMSTCLYTQQNIEEACQVLTDMINNHTDFYSDIDNNSLIRVPKLMLDVLKAK